MLLSRKMKMMDKIDGQARQRLVYYGVPLLGVLLCLWYVKEATCDIVAAPPYELQFPAFPQSELSSDVLNPVYRPLLISYGFPDVLSRIKRSFQLLLRHNPQRPRLPETKSGKAMHP